jgi:hypothetical protein
MHQGCITAPPKARWGTLIGCPGEIREHVARCSGVEVPRGAAQLERLRSEVGDADASPTAAFLGRASLSICHQLAVGGRRAGAGMTS